MVAYAFKNAAVNGETHLENPLTFTVSGKTSVTANYGGQNEVGAVTMKGTVSGQAAAGRKVVITVTGPLGVSIMETTTLADRTYSAAYTDIAGAYSATAKALEDAQYLETPSSTPVSFTIAKLASTITLTVAPA